MNECFRSVKFELEAFSYVPIETGVPVELALTYTISRNALASGSCTQH